jgi:hypothetical protein
MIKKKKTLYQQFPGHAHKIQGAERCCFLQIAFTISCTLLYHPSTLSAYLWMSSPHPFHLSVSSWCLGFRSSPQTLNSERTEARSMQLYGSVPCTSKA